MNDVTVITESTAPSNENTTLVHSLELQRLNKTLFALTGGFILLFCTLPIVDIDALSAAVDWGFTFAATWFGFYWQVLLLATFLIGIFICFLPGSRVVLGNLERPEFTYFQWGSMIMCTLLVGGGVFWAAGEPIAHFLSTPPLFGDLGADPEAHTNAAMAQSFLHWGFLAWAILGSLTTIMLKHYHYDKGLPLAPPRVSASCRASSWLQPCLFRWYCCHRYGMRYELRCL